MVDEMIEVSQSDCQIKMSEETCTVIWSGTLCLSTLALEG